MTEPAEVLGLTRRSIVAPAGHGKTELIARAAGLGRRTLVLTHTHAGVHAIKARLKRLSVPAGTVVVDTIASWANRYAYAFPNRSQVPNASIPPPRGQWSAVNQAAARVLTSPIVHRVIQASYDRVFVDEYQDCDGLQHAIASNLSCIVPTVVFGDPMQGIFEFVPESIRWSAEVLPFFTEAAELTEPHRWKDANPDLGHWIAQTRAKLMAGEPIDLRNGPITYLPVADAFDMGLFFDGMDARNGSVAAIHCNRGLCNRLAQATRGAFQSLEEIAAARLTEFAQAWDRATTPLERRNALASMMNDGIVRSDHIPEEGLDPSFQSNLDQAWQALAASGSPRDAVAVLRREREHPQSRTFRSDLLNDARRALDEVDAGRHEQLTLAAEAMRQRLSHSGRPAIARTLSTPLLLKGLEFDNVLVPDAAHFVRERTAQAKLFYVAISRARYSLTIASSEPVLRFPVPQL